MTIDNQPEEIKLAPPMDGYPGNSIGPRIVTRTGISAHVAHARIKHPHFAASRGQATCVLLSEVREFLWAVFWERDRERIREEALDVIAVLVRWIEGDMGSDNAKR